MKLDYSRVKLFKGGRGLDQTEKKNNEFSNLFGKSVDRIPEFDFSGFDHQGLSSESTFECYATSSYMG